MTYNKKIDVRWSDLDPNFHMLHSKYYDLGAYVRMCYFIENNITPESLQANRIGPILLREECVFRKEIKFGDDVEIDFHLTKAKTNFSRWSIVHQITRNGEIAATINVDGAWIDMDKRKMAIPPIEYSQVFEKMPKINAFEYF
jgi:acyl-CoA thioester hydrolase